MRGKAKGLRGEAYPMLEKVRKGLFAGLGGVLLTKDKVEDLTKHLARESKMDEKQVKSLVDELIETGQGQWEDFEEAVREVVRKSMDVGSGQDLRDLKGSIDALERRMSGLEAEVSVLQTKVSALSSASGEETT
jgi:polyhydroxyalkanoate synthesis regulator phasin